MKKTALLSVSDRSHLVEFGKKLLELDYQLLATSGTGKTLAAAGLPFTAVEEYTGQKEILNGRVKTLHPRLHAGILARRDEPEHMQQLAAQDIAPIDLVVVNLYPFIQNVGSEQGRDLKRMIELIDVGGPSMLRAAAKNFKWVLPLVDPGDYGEVLQLLASEGDVPLERRCRLAGKVFAHLSEYDVQISRYLSTVSFDPEVETFAERLDEFSGLGLGETTGIVLVREQALRYGENPHQRAVFYRPLSARKKPWEQLGGKELSYNNLLDFDAAFRLVRSFPASMPAAVIVKHLNPCGAAVADTLVDALRAAKRGDPRSHFGGIIAFNRQATVEVAEEVTEDFAELVVAPSYSEEALAMLRRRKNLRILSTDMAEAARLELRSIHGGVLMQQTDGGVSDVSQAEVVSSRRPSPEELQDLQFAWNICAHVKSNAITLARKGMLIGTGAGQMSRIDAVHFAVIKAKAHGHELKGSVAASDAFFPFPDSINALAREGVAAVLAPGGSKRDEEVIAAANEQGVALLFSGDRHFKH